MMSEHGMSITEHYREDGYNGVQAEESVRSRTRLLFLRDKMESGFNEILVAISFPRKCGKENEIMCGKLDTLEMSFFLL